MSRMESTPGKRKPLRRCAKVAIIITVALVVLLAAGKYFIVPAIIREAVREGLGKYWDGAVNVEDVEFRYSGSVSLKGLSLVDSAGLEWLRVTSIDVALDRWPSFRPAIREIDLQEVCLRTYTAGGVTQPPWKSPPDGEAGEEGNSHFDLPRFRAGPIRFEAHEDGRLVRAWSGVRIDVSSVNESYDITVNGRVSDKDDWKLRFLSTFISQAGVENTHVVSVSEGALWKNGKPVVEQINLSAQLQDRNVRIPQISATSFGGKITAHLHVRPREDDKTSLIGMGAVNLERLNVADMTGTLTEGSARQGSLSAQYVFNMEPGDISSLRATGKFILDDVEPAADKAGTFSAIMAEVLGKLRIAEIFGKSDTAALFEMEGLVVTVRRAYVSSGLSALEMEPGGKIDLGTGQIDLYVIGVPIRQIRSMLTALPVVRLVETLKDKFTRVHIKGKWDASPADLVQIAPIRHITKGTVDFLQAAAKEGTNIGDGLLRLLEAGG